MKVTYNITQNKINVKFQTGYYPLPGGGGGDLSNYYTKDETYSKTEVDDIIADIPGVDTSNLVPYTGANKDVNIGANYFKTSKGFVFTYDENNYFKTYYSSGYNHLGFYSKDSSADNFGYMFIEANPEIGFVVNIANGDGIYNSFHATASRTYSEKPFVSSEGFIKTGGTSTQFLMADGSVNSNTYIKTSGGNKVLSNWYITSPYEGGSFSFVGDDCPALILGQSSAYMSDEGVFYIDNAGIGQTDPNTSSYFFGSLETYGGLEVSRGFTFKGSNEKTVAETVGKLATNTNTNNFELIFNRSAAGTNAYYDIQSVEQGIGYRNIVLQKDGGNVGIGTTSPSEKLDVNGNVKATGFKTPTGTATQGLKANGDVFDLTTKADLVGGKVPSWQLPSYVDDVLEFANLAYFPTSGESGKIYIALDTNLTYRWGGSSYVVMSSSLALGETSFTAYRGDRGKVAYDHSQTTGNPHGTTKADIGLGNVDNTSDLNKPISTSTQTALDNKQNAIGYIPENVANKATDLSSPDNTKYPTTLAVANENKKATITVELISQLTTNFYAPNALRINSTTLISGSGALTLKVNDVAYTLGNLIPQGAKITAETTSASVYNLISIYE